MTKAKTTTRKKNCRQTASKTQGHIGPATPSYVCDLMVAIKSAGPTDLAVIRDRISELSSELDALDEAEKILALKFDGVRQRQVATAQRRNRKRPSSRPQTLSEMVSGYLIKKGRAVAPEKIAADLGIAVSSVMQVSQFDGYEKTEDGIFFAGGF